MRRRSRQFRRRTGANDDAELELAINEIAADQAAMRLVVQSFLLRLFALRVETAAAAFAELQDHVYRSIEAIPLAPEDQAGGVRWKGLVAASAERLFGEIGDTIGESVPERKLQN